MRNICNEDQTWSFRGSKSRNKVSVGEPAEGSLLIENPFSNTQENGNRMMHYLRHSHVWLVSLTAWADVFERHVTKIVFWYVLRHHTCVIRESVTIPTIPLLHLEVVSVLLRRKKTRLNMGDHLVLKSMKNIVICGNWCELWNFVSIVFLNENFSMDTFVSVLHLFQYINRIIRIYYCCSPSRQSYAIV